MTNKKKRITIAILGFFVLAIPLIFLCYNINREFEFTKGRVEEDLKEKLLISANKIEENLTPYNYLNNEFNLIHKNLFPDFPEEVIEGNPEDTFIKDMYSEETYKKLLSLVKDKYSPIIVELGDQNINNIYTYLAPILENAFPNKKEKEELLKTLHLFDLDKLNYKFKYIYRRTPENYFYRKLIKEKESLNKSSRKYLEYSYKYISRFSSYDKLGNSLYTDYFNKQNLFPIKKTTISRKGIHGFYYCLIPQDHVDPELVLKSAIDIHKSSSDIKIELIENNKKSVIPKNNNELKYILNFHTDFKNLVNTYYQLREITPKNILKYQIELTAQYPKMLFYFYYFKNSILFISITIIIFYIFFSLKLINRPYFQIKELSNKLIIILCVILLLPILGISLLCFIIYSNLSELTDLYIHKSLHNNLESVRLLDEENELKRLTAVLEMKKIISNTDFKKNLEDSNKKLILFNKIPKWFSNFTSNFFIIPENENKKIYHFDKFGINFKNYIVQEKNQLVTKVLLSKYLKNLGFLNTKEEYNKDYFALSYLESYIDSRKEGENVIQESVPDKDILQKKEYDTSIYFYAKDKNNKIYSLLTSLTSNSERRYNFLYSFIENNPKVFSPNNKYADLNLAITFKSFFQGNNRIQFPQNIIDKELNDLLSKAIKINNSNKEKIQSNNNSIIKEWIISNKNPLIVAGIAKEKNTEYIKYIISMIFPILLTYTVLLLILLNGFISGFIKKPIEIIRKAIYQLKEYNFGITIESFSNDEFNNITTAFNEMSIAIKQKEQMKRYVSDRLIKSVESNDVQEAGDGKQEKVTILSSDIRNFTGTSEKYEPSEIVEMLNSYFTRMQHAISDNGGIIDKYIGDAIQAVFYDEPDKENQVIRASKAALAMRKALKDFNEERKDKGLFTIENGIGIDTDFAITGTIGTSKGRKDFSVNGDVINRAAELEAKTKGTTSKILISKKSLDWIATQSSTARNVSSNSNIDNDNKTNHTLHQSHLVFKIFDNDSVELIDVRE